MNSKINLKKKIFIVYFGEKFKIILYYFYFKTNIQIKKK